MGGEMAAETMHAVRREVGDAQAGATQPKWGGLYAILFLSVGLCLIGYRVASGIGRPALVQCAVVLIVLGLLRGWIGLNRSAPVAESNETTSSTPPVSVLRIALSRQSQSVRPTPAPEPTVARR